MGGILGVIVSLLGSVIGGLSPVFRTFLGEILDKAEQKAKSTDSPFDDIFVSLAKGVLGLD